MFCPIYLLLTKPVWSEWANFGKTFSILLTSTLEKILWSILSRDIGSQFFNSVKFSLPFGMSVIVPRFWDIDNEPSRKALL